MTKKVLVVDNNANNLMLETDLLKVSGFQVFSAVNAVEAIACAIEYLPDIIVMDFRLQDMHGTEAAGLLRLNDKTKDIPIVFVTASIMPANRESIEAIDNSGFIGKPIDTRTFATEIRRFLK